MQRLRAVELRRAARPQEEPLQVVQLRGLAPQLVQEPPQGLELVLPRRARLRELQPALRPQLVPPELPGLQPALGQQPVFQRLERPQ